MEEINYGLEELHNIQVEMLKKLISVIKEHNMDYFLAFGSLLGAARNHRVIPWDDSIDIVMPYQDYKRLLDLPKETWNDGLFLQTYSTDVQYPKCYAKLRNSQTTLIMADYVSYDINHGIYINIIPLVKLANDAEQRKKQIKDAKLYKAVVENKMPPSSDATLRLRASVLLASSEAKKHSIREELKEKILKYEDTDANDCFALAGDTSLNLVLPSKWFASSEEMEFENMLVNVPEGWDEWLRLRYGDYMVEPISDLQSDKVSKFITLNTQQPYSNYKGKTYCL